MAVGRRERTERPVAGDACARDEQTCSRTVFENNTNDVAGFFGPPCGILFLRLRDPLAGGSPAAAAPFPVFPAGGGGA